MDINVKVSFDTAPLKELMYEFFGLLKDARKEHVCHCHHDKTNTQPTQVIQPPKVEISESTPVVEEPKEPSKSSSLSSIRCACCGNEFVPGRRTQRFCCKECSITYNCWNNSPKLVSLKEYYERKTGKTPVGDPKTCEHCGKEFLPTCPEQKFCSSDCKIAAHEKRKEEKAVQPTKSCAICKMSFVPKGPNSRYCEKCVDAYGSECKDIEQDEIVKAAMEAESKKIHHKVCPRCGANFESVTGEDFFCPKCVARATRAPKIEPLPKESDQQQTA